MKVLYWNKSATAHRCGATAASVFFSFPDIDECQNQAAITGGHLTSIRCVMAGYLGEPAYRDSQVEGMQSVCRYRSDGSRSRTRERERESSALALNKDARASARLSRHSFLLSSFCHPFPVSHSCHCLSLSLLLTFVFCLFFRPRADRAVFAV